MARKVGPGQIDTFVVTNANVSGLDFSGVLVGGANNHNAVVDYKKCTISAVLHRNGGQCSIVQGNLFSLLKAQYFYDDRYEQLDPVAYNAATPHGDVLVAKGGSVKGSTVHTLQLNFSGIINLRGSDRLEVEMQWSQQASTATAASLDATSYLTIDFIPGIGLEYFTPTIKTYAVQDGQNEWTRGLGNNLQALHFINADKTNTLTANQVVEVCQFKSDKLSYSKNYQQLLAERNGQSEKNLERFQSFALYAGNNELDKAALELRLNDGNVTAGNNYIVVRTFKVQRQVVAKARAKSRRHARKTAVKFG